MARIVKRKHELRVNVKVAADCRVNRLVFHRHNNKGRVTIMHQCPCGRQTVSWLTAEQGAAIGEFLQETEGK